MGEKYLKEAYKDFFDMGAAVNIRSIDTHSQLLKDHFSSITCENEMKFSLIHPERNKYAFDNADKIINFAVSNNMKVRGHTLVWHNQTPDWVFKNEKGGKASKEDLTALLTEHVNTVALRYKGKVQCYDVVNEAISDNREDFLRPTKWLEILGEDYIDLAFNMAHKADPAALLFYNDYNESHPVKREKIYKLVKGMKERGIPIHGVGLQAHWNIFDPSLDTIKSAFEKYAELGLKLHVTEMDISAFDFTDRRTDLKFPEEGMLEKVAKMYEKTFEIFRQYKGVLTNVTTWGAADDSTWLDNFPVKGRKNWPLIFDENHRPKKAFDYITNF